MTELVRKMKRAHLRMSPGIIDRLDAEVERLRRMGDLRINRSSLVENLVRQYLPEPAGPNGQEKP